jgi:pimeloyl-ACP methyl ester carboxylesterase
MRMVRVDGVTVMARRSGHGRPLLLLNGIGCGVETWEPLEAALPGFELLSFDPPGIGRSPNTRWPLGLGGLVRVAMSLADSCAWKEFDVLGVSWGGIVAQQLAHDHPDRVGRLVLCATTCGPGSFCLDPLVIAMMSTPLPHTSKWFARMVAPYLYGADIREYPEAFEAFERRQPPTVPGFYAQALAATGWSSLPWLHNLRSPTLVMAGRRDRIVPPAVAGLLARAIPNSSLHMVDGGHLFLLLRSAESAAVIRRFLES